MADKGVRFSQIIQNRELLDVMVGYLQAMRAQEGFEFWVDVELFKRTKDKKKSEEAAKNIYAKYMQPESIAEINIDYKMRMEVSDALSNGLWDYTLFDKVQEHIVELIKSNCLKGSSFTTFKTGYKTVNTSRLSTRSHNFFANVNKYWEIRKKERTSPGGHSRSGDENKHQNRLLISSLKKQLSKAVIKLTHTNNNNENNNNNNSNNNESDLQWVNAVIYDRRNTC